MATIGCASVGPDLLGDFGGDGWRSGPRSLGKSGCDLTTPAPDGKPVVIAGAVIDDPRAEGGRNGDARRRRT
jgi:hypothetical protein